MYRCVNDTAFSFAWPNSTQGMAVMDLIGLHMPILLVVLNVGKRELTAIRFCEVYLLN